MSTDPFAPSGNRGRGMKIDFPYKLFESFEPVLIPDESLLAE
jgi:hypothetical protein